MFKNKVVLVTGGSAGIGAAAAELFAKEGASVAIVGRNEAKLKEVLERCKKHGSQAFAIKADVSKKEEVDGIVQKAVDKFGKLDVLVNNAGILREAPVDSKDFLESFDEVINVNLRGPARITHFAVPHIIKTKGNIVNVSSVASSCTSRPNYAAYRTSKAGLTHFTRCCALELAKHGVRVNAVSPGPVMTSIFDNLATPVAAAVDALTEHTVLKKMSEADEIAELIVYVASDKARSVTGSDYVIDNGTLLV